MATSINPLPLPSNEKIVQLRDRQRYPRPTDRDPHEGLITQRWQEYLDRLASGQAASVTRVNTAEELGKSASVAATDMSGSALAAGTYQFDWFVSIRTPAGVSSSVIVTVDFTYRGATKSLVYATVNGNLTSTFGHDGGIIAIDKSSPVRYTLTYASNPGGAMVYDAIFVLSRVNA